MLTFYLFVFLGFCFFAGISIFVFISSFVPETSPVKPDGTDNLDEITGKAFGAPLCLVYSYLALFIVQLMLDSKNEFLVSIKSLISVLETPIMFLSAFLFIYCLILGIKLFKQIETKELSYPSLLSVGIILISSGFIYFLVLLIMIPFYVSRCKKRKKLQQIIKKAENQKL